MVDVAAGGGGGAAGEAAGAVAAADEPGGRLAGPVDPGVDREQAAGVGVVQDGPEPGVGVGQQPGQRLGRDQPDPGRLDPDPRQLQHHPAGPPPPVPPPQEHPPPRRTPAAAARARVPRSDRRRRRGLAVAGHPAAGRPVPSSGPVRALSGMLSSSVVVIVAWPRIRSIIASARAWSRRPVLAVGDVGVRELVDRGPGRRAGLGRLRGDPLAHPRIQAGADQDEPAGPGPLGPLDHLLGVGHRDRPPGRGPDPGGRQAQHGREQHRLDLRRRPPGAAGAPPGRSPRPGPAPGHRPASPPRWPAAPHTPSGPSHRSAARSAAPRAAPAPARRPSPRAHPAARDRPAPGAPHPSPPGPRPAPHPCASTTPRSPAPAPPRPRSAPAGSPRPPPAPRPDPHPAPHRALSPSSAAASAATSPAATSSTLDSNIRTILAAGPHPAEDHPQAQSASLPRRFADQPLSRDRDQRLAYRSRSRATSAPWCSISRLMCSTSAAIGSAANGPSAGPHGRASPSSPSPMTPSRQAA